MKGENMHKRNPKQDGSNVFDCKPQSGKCPMNCNQCFYNREDAFYVDRDSPWMPPLEDVGDGIMRVNSGHDSNCQRSFVIDQTEQYSKRFFNTSIPKFEFPGPVVFTANPKEEERAVLPMDVEPVPENIMFVRLRVSSTNLEFVENAASCWSAVGVPVVLTFMAYYDHEPECPENYEWKQRHINSYWCPTPKFLSDTLQQIREYAGRSVTLCGSVNEYKCMSCRNCETYYYQTVKRMRGE